MREFERTLASAKLVDRERASFQHEKLTWRRSVMSWREIFLALSMGSRQESLKMRNTASVGGAYLLITTEASAWRADLRTREDASAVRRIVTLTNTSADASVEAGRSLFKNYKLLFIKHLVFRLLS